MYVCEPLFSETLNLSLDIKITCLRILFGQTMPNVLTLDFVFVSLRYCTQLEYDKNVDGRWNMQVK